MEVPAGYRSSNNSTFCPNMILACGLQSMGE